jgi:hypothetical protein
LEEVVDENGEELVARIVGGCCQCRRAMTMMVGARQSVALLFGTRLLSFHSVMIGNPPGVNKAQT